MTFEPVIQFFYASIVTLGKIEINKYFKILFMLGY